jgi:hypothetical protein
MTSKKKHSTGNGYVMISIHVQKTMINTTKDKDNIKIKDIITRHAYFVSMNQKRYFVMNSTTSIIIDREYSVNRKEYNSFQEDENYSPLHPPTFK